MQFLGEGKDKNIERRDAECAEEKQRKTETKALDPELLPSRVALQVQNPLNPVLAHTCARDRCKSFISIHIVNEGGGGVGNFFGWHLFD